MPVLFFRASHQSRAARTVPRDPPDPQRPRTAAPLGRPRRPRCPRHRRARQQRIARLLDRAGQFFAVDLPFATLSAVIRDSDFTKEGVVLWPFGSRPDKVSRPSRCFGASRNSARKRDSPRTLNVDSTTRSPRNVAAAPSERASREPCAAPAVLVADPAVDDPAAENPAAADPVAPGHPAADPDADLPGDRAEPCRSKTRRHWSAIGAAARGRHHRDAQHLNMAGNRRGSGTSGGPSGGIPGAAQVWGRRARTWGVVRPRRWWMVRRKHEFAFAFS